MGDEIETEEYKPRGMRAIEVAKEDIYWDSPKSLSEYKREEWAELGHC